MLFTLHSRNRLILVGKFSLCFLLGNVCYVTIRQFSNHPADKAHISQSHGTSSQVLWTCQNARLSMVRLDNY